MYGSDSLVLKPILATTQAREITHMNQTSGTLTAHVYLAHALPPDIPFNGDNDRMLMYRWDGQINVAATQILGPGANQHTCFNFRFPDVLADGQQHVSRWIASFNRTRAHLSQYRCHSISMIRSYPLRPVALANGGWVRAAPASQPSTTSSPGQS